VSSNVVAPPRPGPPVEHDGLPIPQRYWAILTIGIAVAMSVLGSAIANIALPTISRQLHITAVDSIWIVNAYPLTITVSLLPFAALGDILGYRRVYWVGLAVFTAASGACALSHSLAALTVARVIQGFGAAGIMSVNTALIRFVYPRHLLGRGIGINALVVATASAAGTTVGAGAAFAIGDAEAGDLQPVSLAFRMQGVETRPLLDFVRAHPEHFGLADYVDKRMTVADAADALHAQGLPKAVLVADGPLMRQAIAREVTSTAIA